MSYLFCKKNVKHLYKNKMIIHVKAEVNEANAKNAMAKTNKRGGPGL